MREIQFPYGRGHLTCALEEDRLHDVLLSGVESYVPEHDQQELVRLALENPVGQPRLSKLAEGKKNIVVITSDHTRPVPSKITLPLLLEEIRRGAPQADVTILVATGCHRSMTEAEQLDKFGEEVCRREKIVVHDCDDAENLTDIGQLPSGGRCIVNRLAVEADLLVAEGFIEPHFFAGFSGGRKAVLPGVAGRATVLENHCSRHIAHEKARTGILEGNPIHEDMVWAARRAGLAFILNVVLNAEKKIIFAVAGDMEKAHACGCDFLSRICRVSGKASDIVITTNGGYPLDQNVYQSPKGMTAAETVVRDGGVIIMLASSSDGVGGDAFYHQLADEADISRTMAMFLSREPAQTVPDQWQTQILLRILKKASVIYVSELPDETIRALHMTPAHSLQEALKLACERLGNPNASITAIPDGVSVVTTLKG